MLLGKLLRPMQTGAVQVYGAFISVGALAIFAWAIGAPAVVLSQRIDGTTARIEASGGPGYTYRWASYEVSRDATSDTLEARCPLAGAGTTALSHVGNGSAETRHDEALQGTSGRCVVVEARNAFGLRAYARALVISNNPGTIVVPGTN
jgi:hypothetical protein